MQQLLLLTKSENPDSTPKPSGERPAHHPELAPWSARTRHEESTVITAPARGSDAATPDELVSALLTASRALVGVSARSLAHVEDAVTITQFRTLVVLEGHGDTRLNQLAERLAVTPSTAMRMVDRLIAAHLVTREENKADRREVLIGLTHEGARLVREVTERRRAEIATIVAAMPEEGRQDVVAALNAFAQAAGEATPSADTATRLGW
jgi:DNA-binding MarR family transcriptional regulator